LAGQKVNPDLYAKIKSTQAYWSGNEVIGEYVGSLIQFFKELNKQTRQWSVVSSEQTLVNETLGYGGRGDLLLKVGENYMMLDLKTNSGYFNQYTQTQVCHWNLWRKPVKIDVMVTKEYANGNTRQIKKKGVDGKAIKQLEKLPPVEERGWEYVDSKIKDKFVQLCLYSLAMDDMKKKGRIDFVPETAAILVAFPRSYQLIKMPYSIWAGAKEESIRRVEEYREKHWNKFLLEVAYREGT
jgi:hypothetical protein